MFFIYLCIIILIGSRMRALGNIMHECSHNIFVQSKKNNFIIGALISILLFDCFVRYKKSHFAHHAHLGKINKDPDYNHYKNIKINYFQNNNLNILCSILNPYHWYLNIKSMILITSKHKTIFYFKIIYLSILLCLSVFYFKYVCLFYWIPYFTTYQMFKIFSDIVDHDDVYEQININDRSRNHIFNSSVLNWLFFPRNDAYHLIHHLYPRLPVSRYKQAHENLLKKNHAYGLKNHSCDLQKF